VDPRAIHVRDDHEFADDPIIGGAANHQPERAGDWSTRVAAALQAYTEWMPTRIDGNRVFRTLQYRNLATIVGLDRQRRFLWPDPADAGEYLGAEQAAWLDQQVAWIDSRWLVHAIDVVTDPAAYHPVAGTGSGAVEFACGSISSPGSSATGVGRSVRWNTGFTCGYAVVDLTPDRFECDFYGFPDLAKLLGFLPQESWLAGWGAAHGTPVLTGRRNALGSRNRPPLAALA
jgi:hypothetical protein